MNRDQNKLFLEKASMKEILDFIDSLEEENQASKQTINELSNQVAKLIEENKQLKERYKNMKENFDSKVEVIADYSQRINKAIHRIQLLQMDNEVTVRDLGLIARDLKGDNNE